MPSIDWTLVGKLTATVIGFLFAGAVIGFMCLATDDNEREINGVRVSRLYGENEPYGDC